MPIRCLIVEDEVMFAHMLAGMLRGIPGLAVAGIAHTCTDGLLADEELQPDLLLIDLALPDGSGLDVARQAARRDPTSRTIVLSGEASTFVVPAVLRDHIHAVVEKTKAYTALQRQVVELLATDSGAGAPADPEALLSPRERDVFRQLGLGLLSKQIADRLGIAPATVALHRKRIAGKLNARGAKLVRLAALHHRAQAS
jgi:DNA-binding NarL/FixJ family response regulator